MTAQHISLYSLVQKLPQSFENERESLGIIISHFSDRSLAFFIFLFALPAALPVPAVGYGTILGIPLIFLCLQQMIQRDHIWLPRFLARKTISKDMARGLCEKSAPWLKRMDVIIKPRLHALTGIGARRIAGILGVVMALCVCIPLPLTNTVPSFGLALMAAGFLTRDGLAVLAGALIGTAWTIMIFLILYFLGAEGLDLVKTTIKNYL